MLLTLLIYVVPHIIIIVIINLFLYIFVKDVNFILWEENKKMNWLKNQLNNVICDRLKEIMGLSNSIELVNFDYLTKMYNYDFDNCL